MNNLVKMAEDYLRSQQKWDEEGIPLDDETEIINRLLSHNVLMRPVYIELITKFRFKNWEEFLRLAVVIAAYHNPAKIRQLRDNVRSVVELNRSIAKKARELGELIKKRGELCEGYGIWHGEDDVVRCLNKAAELSGNKKKNLYESWVKPEIDLLNHKFEEKYWPDLHFVLFAAAEFAETSKPKVLYSISSAAISSRQSSVYDFFRAFIESLSINRIDIRLSDQSFCDLINCLLDLHDDADVSADQKLKPSTASQVKMFFSRSKEAD